MIGMARCGLQVNPLNLVLCGETHAPMLCLRSRLTSFMCCVPVVLPLKGQEHGYCHTGTAAFFHGSCSA